MAAKVIVDQQFTRDFVAACGYFSPNKWPEFMDQLSWSTDKPSPTSAAFMPSTDKQAEEVGHEAAMAAEVRHDAEDCRLMSTEAGDGVVVSTVSANITDPNRSFMRSEWETFGSIGHSAVLSMRDRTHCRGGRGGVRFQEGENERTISTAIVEYHDADDAQNRQSDDALTDRARRQERPRLWLRRLQKARRSKLTPCATGFAYVTTSAAHPH
jgi:hypothetical protein